MQYFPIFLVLLILLVLISRPLTVLLHELGHAIPAILLTKQLVTIYVGSYGDPRRSIKFKIGQLEVYFRYNPFAWKLGLCVPSSKSISVNRQILYTITGPITSVVIAIIACYFTFTYDLHGLLKLFFIVFLGSAVLDLVVNLIPRDTPITLYDGRITHNDGYNLRRLFYYKRLPKEYLAATEYYNEQQYSEAAVLLTKILSSGIKDENVYRFAIICYLQNKNYREAKDLSNEFIQLYKMNSDDLANAGLSYSQLGLHDKALELYDASLVENPNNKHSLNNKGYTLNLLNRYQEAIPVFDKAIELDKNFAYSYNNRGLSKIKTGQEEEGLRDINFSLNLDKGNSYGYRNLGIYHFDKREYRKALELFVKAKELDSATHMIDQLITETEQRYKKTGNP